MMQKTCLTSSWHSVLYKMYGFFFLFLRDSIEHMLEARSLTFDTHSVFLEASHTPLPLGFDTYPLGGNVLHVRGMLTFLLQSCF